MLEVYLELSLDVSQEWIVHGMDTEGFRIRW